MRESDIQAGIIDYLELKKVCFWRNNVGMAKFGDHYVRYGAVGSPDIFCLQHGRIYGLEVKNEKGKLSENQEAFKEKFIFNGGLYFIVRSIEDAMNIFKE